MPIDEIEVIKQKLVDQIKPIGVYLFGSFAMVPRTPTAILTSTLL